jgi:hypothetical protein
MSNNTLQRRPRSNVLMLRPVPFAAPAERERYAARIAFGLWRNIRADYRIKKELLSAQEQNLLSKLNAELLPIGTSSFRLISVLLLGKLCREPETGGNNKL